MKRAFLIAICVLTLIGVSAGMTIAYMTDSTVPVENMITMGNVDIELKEEKWKESNAKKLHPLQTVPKDPTVTNIGSHPAYVFLEVQVPVKTIRTIDQNGRKTNAAPHELFTFMYDSTKWTLIRTQNLSDCNCYIYGYQNVLNPGEQTSPLFERVTSVNYLEGELNPNDSYVIDIHARALQSQIDTEHLTMEQMYELLMGELSLQKDRREQK